MSINNNIVICARDARKNYGATQALRGANIDVRRGEVLAIMGPSGSGKSTLLHCLAGIDTLDKGEILYGDENISKWSDRRRTNLRRGKFGFIFQFSQLVPELTALDNVAIPLLLNGVGRREAYDRAKTWLHRVGINGDKVNHMASQLSGGQVQRVAIARAMITNPEILFADEPTGSLDSLNSEMVMEMFIKMAKDHGTTVIMVTHEPTIAAYADREVIVRDGRVEDHQK